MRQGTEFGAATQRPIVNPQKSQTAHVQGEQVRQVKTDIPQVRQEDLKPEAMAFRINQIVQTLAAEIARVQGRSGPFRFDIGPLSFAGQVDMMGQVFFTSTVHLRGTTDRSGNAVPLLFDLDLPVYAGNDAAKEGGLAKGSLYRTEEGDLKVVF